MARRLLRRASRYGFKYLGAKEPFLYKMVAPLARKLGGAFPELKDQQEFIARVVEQEEISFIDKLERGSQMFEEYVAARKAKGDVATVDGKFAFELYDTYGFPYDLTETMAREIGWQVDRPGFEEQMKAQRERSKAAAAKETGDWTDVNDGIDSVFVGYTRERSGGEYRSLPFGEDQEKETLSYRPEYHAVLCGERRTGRRYRYADERRRDDKRAGYCLRKRNYRPRNGQAAGRSPRASGRRRSTPTAAERYARITRLRICCTARCGKSWEIM